MKKSFNADPYDVDQNVVKKIHDCTAAFLQVKNKELLAQFFDLSGLAAMLYEERPDNHESPEEHRERMIEKFNMSFAVSIGRAYAFGHTDGMQGKTVKEILVPGTLVKKPDVDVKQLAFPKGILASEEEE